ncbi:MAG: CvpA family protein [Candidatus Cloacimonadota bacterium]
MGIIDWSIVVVLVFFFIYGLRRGFAAMVTQLLGYLALFLLVGQYYPLVKHSLITKFSWPNPLATVAAFVLISALIFIVVRIVIFILNRTLKVVHLSFLNRLAGGIFGFINALLVMMILMVLLDYIPSLSTPLKNQDTHLAYFKVDELKTSAFNTFKLKQHLQMLEEKVEHTIDSGIKLNERK